METVQSVQAGLADGGRERADGVDRIIMHTKIHMDNSRLFEYLGYKHTDKLYTKILSTESV